MKTNAPSSALGTVAFRSPTAFDGAKMWQIAASLPQLDINSPYAYLMAGRDFGDTSIVAIDGEEIVGFITAYRPHRAPEVLFVWQVAVSAPYHSVGVGRQMLDTLVRQVSRTGVEYVEATVTPSNIPSQRLFKSLAGRLGTRCEIAPCFPGTAFPGEAHEDEELYRIGPIPQG
jgi:L-2,4-diaminobutyric acid acetyltransferase